MKKYYWEVWNEVLEGCETMHIHECLYNLS